jgi:hypothetical protein
VYGGGNLVMWLFIYIDQILNYIDILNYITMNINRFF